jgi:hypothetical protein
MFHFSWSIPNLYATADTSSSKLFETADQESNKHTLVIHYQQKNNDGRAQTTIESVYKPSSIFNLKAKRTVSMRRLYMLSFRIV